MVVRTERQAVSHKGVGKRTVMDCWNRRHVQFHSPEWIHSFIRHLCSLGGVRVSDQHVTACHASRAFMAGMCEWTFGLADSCCASWWLITNTRKFDRGLTSIRHDDLHCLDLPRRVLYKSCVTVYKSLHGMAPKYLAELCRPISDVQGRRHLRSAARGLLLTPRYYLSTYGRRAFSCAGPSAWNSLPEHLRASDLTLNSFRHSLKTFLFTQMTHARWQDLFTSHWMESRLRTSSTTAVYCLTPVDAHSGRVLATSDR